MPTIVELGSIQIRVYPRDHQPPHFHISTSDGVEAMIRISDLSMIKGRIRNSDLKLALKWARENRSLIEDAWNAQN